MTFVVEANTYGSWEPDIVAAPMSVSDGDFVIVPSQDYLPHGGGLAETIGDGFDEEVRWVFDFGSDPSFDDFRVNATSGRGDVSVATLSLWMSFVRPDTANAGSVRLGGLPQFLNGQASGGLPEIEILPELPSSQIGQGPNDLKAWPWFYHFEFDVLASGYISDDLLDLFLATPDPTPNATNIVIVDNHNIHEASWPVPAGRIPAVYSTKAMIARARLRLTLAVGQKRPPSPPRRVTHKHYVHLPRHPPNPHI